jgi:hypothetical protein
VPSAVGSRSKEAHPDLGGTAEMFRVLVEARALCGEIRGYSMPNATTGLLI